MPWLYYSSFPCLLLWLPVSNQSHMVRPVQSHVLLRIVTIISSVLVCFLIREVNLLPLRVIPNAFLSIQISHRKHKGWQLPLAKSPWHRRESGNRCVTGCPLLHFTSIHASTIHTSTLRKHRRLQNARLWFTGTVQQPEEPSLHCCCVAFYLPPFSSCMHRSSSFVLLHYRDLKLSNIYPAYEF